MIFGIGTDIVSVERVASLFEKFGDKFSDKYFTQNENKQAKVIENYTQRINYYAKRFAGKEACSKALGTGFRMGVSWQNIEITSDELQRPILTLNGKALEKAMEITNVSKTSDLNLQISLSDEPPFAIAFVLIGCK